MRPFCGFGQCGFQILLPLSPRHCLFFYDPKTYKAGTRNGRLIELQDFEVTTINALEIQSAERCVYFNSTVPETVEARGYMDADKLSVRGDYSRHAFIREHFKIPDSTELYLS